MSNSTQNDWEKGQQVVICDGIRTGTIGIVGGIKGTSVAVCIKGMGGQDCDGMCPDGGTYEPEYALLRFTEEDRRPLELLLSHIRSPQELADARKEVIREVETQRDLLEATMKDSERKSGYYLSGLVRLSMAILATLRKESK